MSCRFTNTTEHGHPAMLGFPWLTPLGHNGGHLSHGHIRRLVGSEKDRLALPQLRRPSLHPIPPGRRLFPLDSQNLERNGDPSRADFAVAVRAVNLQLPDYAVLAELQKLMTAARARKHRPVERYLAYTAAKARRLTGVMAPSF